MIGYIDPSQVPWRSCSKSKMSHQNKAIEFFKRRVMVFSLIKIWLAIGVLHQENMGDILEQWSLKGENSYHVKIVIWSEMFGDHDSISPTLFTNLIPNIGGSTFFKAYFLLRIASKISSFKIMGFFLPSILEQDLDLGFFNSCFHGKNLKRM